jgi:hypothetical protein
MFHLLSLKTACTCFAAVLLLSADVRPVNAETTAVDDDAKRLADLAEWLSGAWGYSRCENRVRLSNRC